MLDLETDLQTPARAAENFTRSAALGSADAAYALALLYKHGRGVSEDRNKAAQFMKQAAATDLVAAQIEYGIMLFNGDGTAKDEAAAAKLFQKAARIGNPIAANRLARLYATGRGRERNMVEAMKWEALFTDKVLNIQIRIRKPATTTGNFHQSPSSL
jgi:TPR repeat protein